MSEQKNKKALFHNTKEWLKTYKWPCVSSFLLLTCFGLALQLNNKEKHLYELSQRIEKTNYTIAVTKDGQKITAAEMMNKLIITNETKQSIRQAMLQNIAIKNYINTVTNKQLETQLENECFEMNMTEKEYLQQIQKSKKEWLKETKEQLAVVNALAAHTTVSSNEIKEVQKNYIGKGQFLIAVFNNQENAENLHNDLLEKQKNHYTLNEKTVTHIFQHAKGILNDKWLKQTISNYNDRYPITVNDQIWQTTLNTPSIVIQNDAKEVTNKRFYVVFPLKKDKAIEKPTTTQLKEIAEIAKRTKLTKQDEIQKAMNDLFQKSNIKYREPWNEVIR